MRVRRKRESMKIPVEVVIGEVGQEVGLGGGVEIHDRFDGVRLRHGFLRLRLLFPERGPAGSPTLRDRIGCGAIPS